MGEETQEKLVADGSDEQRARLNLVEQEGGYVLTATEGSEIPAKLVVVDADGQPIALYSAGPVESPQLTVRSFQNISGGPSVLE